MRFEAAISGCLHSFMREQAKAARKAITEGIKEATLGLKSDLRAQVIKAGLGNKLANTWRHKCYLNDKHSVAGLVYSKAPKVIRAFNEGALIKSRKGLFLAIPTPAAPKKGIGGKRISPKNFPEHLYGKLRFVYRNNAPSLLVTDSKRKASSRTKQLAKVMFILLPQVQMKKCLNMEVVKAKWFKGASEVILKHWHDQQT